MSSILDGLLDCILERILFRVVEVTAIFFLCDARVSHGCPFLLADSSWVAAPAQSAQRPSFQAFVLLECAGSHRPLQEGEDVLRRIHLKAQLVANDVHRLHEGE